MSHFPWSCYGLGFFLDHSSPLLGFLCYLFLGWYSLSLPTGVFCFNLRHLSLWCLLCCYLQSHLLRIWVFPRFFPFGNSVLGPKMLSELLISLAVMEQFLKLLPHTIFIMSLEYWLHIMTWDSWVVLSCFTLLQ